MGMIKTHMEELEMVDTHCDDCGHLLTDENASRGASVCYDCDYEQYIADIERQNKVQENV